MAYQEAAAERIRAVLKRRKGITERKMFGGLAFMLNGNMVCGVNQTDLVLRLGEAGTAEALKEPHTRDMDFTGKPLKSMVYVDAAGYKSDAQLKAWIERALKFARTLPKK